MKRLHPNPIERPWGGSLLARLFAWENAPERIGEAIIHDGATRPLLGLKWIHAGESLSIQVHPSRPGFSKRELWYFVEAPRDGRIITGLASPFDAPDLESHLEYTPVAAGDLVEIPAGRIHALTPGALVLEVHEPIDMTYRIHDWGRGRPLHLAEAEGALTTEPIIRHPRANGGGYRRVIARPEFVVEDLAGPLEFKNAVAGILSFVAGPRLGESWALDSGDLFALSKDDEAIWACLPE
jgi:mannose-6-phosphate isomerase